MSFVDCTQPVFYQIQIPYKCRNDNYKIILETFKRDPMASQDNCILLSPITGFSIKREIECAEKCLELLIDCEGFIFSRDAGTCKLVGKSGRTTSDCYGEHYTVYF